MAIRHTREMSIQAPDPAGLGLTILAARWTAGARVGRFRRSLTHLGVRSLSCSLPAFAATAQRADSRYQTLSRDVQSIGAA